PLNGGAGLGWIVGSSQRAGVLTKQVVQPVAAGRGLTDEVLVIQLLEAPVGGVEIGVVERGSGVGVDAGARDQAKAAEQPLLAGGEVGVGQAERGGDRQVLGTQKG